MPETLPTSCQKFPTILNCSELFEANSSTPIKSGYFSMQTSNGSQVLVYCNVEDYIDGDSCSKKSSAPSGYYAIQSPNGFCISVYCDMEGSNCDDNGG